jgi:hypothetical protein
MPNHSHAPGPDNSKPAPDYAVGYGLTPKHTRFKDGHAKLGGRRKGQRNRRTVVDEVLNEKITVRRGKLSRRITKFEAMIMKTVDDALLGKPKALSTIIALTRSLDLMGEPHEATHAEPVTGDDRAVIADFVSRFGNQVELTQTPATNEKSDAGKAEHPSKETKERKL